MRARVVVAALLVTGAALAKPPPPKPAPPPPVAKPVQVAALAKIAAEVAAGIGKVAPGTLVAVSALTSDVPSPRGEELSLRVATLVASKLDAKAHPQAASLAVARGAAGRVGSLVYVQLEVKTGSLNATADLYPVVANGWERLRNPAPGPQAHAFVTAPLDAEVRTFLQPIVLEQAAVHKAKLEEQDVVAVGCGDLDSDGGLEIALATRARVVVGKLRGGKYVPGRTAAWSDLAARAPVPLHEPLGSVVLRPGELWVGTTDRGGVAVDPALAVLRPLAGLPLPGSDACVAPEASASAFAANAIGCAKGEVVTATPRADAIASLGLIGKDGTASEVLVAREPGGKLRLKRSDLAKETTLDGAGAQLAVADLDLDGTAEIAVTGDLAEGDTITVYSWRTNGLVPRLKLATKEPVRALAACPPEERGAPGLVAIVGSELWLVR